MPFESDLLFLLPLIVGFAIAYVATPPTILAAQRLGILDIPDARRIHVTPVPRCGGLVIFLGFQAACYFLFHYHEMPHFKGQLTAHWWEAFALGSSLLVIVGLIDDVRGLKWYTKLAAQIAVSFLMFRYDIRIGHLQELSLPPFVDLFLTTLWFLGFINAFNLIDGLDGLATGLGLIAALGLAGAFFFRRQPGDALAALSLAATCLAFLRYNFHPARIFLGDSGSMFLGFTLASLSLATSSKSTLLASLGVALFAIGIPIFDTVLAIWRRSVRTIVRGGNGSAVMQADMDHVHHRMMRSGFTQRKVALSLYIANILLVGVGLLSLVYHSRAAGIFLITFVVGAYVVVRHLARVELWDSGAAVLRGIRRPQSRVLIAILYPVADAVLLVLALGISCALTITDTDSRGIAVAVLLAAPLWCGIPFIGLFLSATYSRVWSRARPSEYAVTALVLLAGALSCLGLEIVIGNLEGTVSSVFIFTIIYASFSTFSILALRAFPRVIEDMMEFTNLPTPAKKRVLLYGAGDVACSFLRLRSAFSTHDEIYLGFIDDDVNLRKRLVYGLRIVGTGLELPRLLDKLQVTDIVVTATLTQERKVALAQLCSTKGIALQEWIERAQPLALEGDKALPTQKTQLLQRGL